MNVCASPFLRPRAQMAVLMSEQLDSEAESSQKIIDALLEAAERGADLRVTLNGGLEFVGKSAALRDHFPLSEGTGPNPPYGAVVVVLSVDKGVLPADQDPLPYTATVSCTEQDYGGWGDVRASWYKRDASANSDVVETIEATRRVTSAEVV